MTAKELWIEQQGSRQADRPAFSYKRNVNFKKKEGMNQASLQRRRSSARLTGLAHIFHHTMLYIYIWVKPFHEYLTHEKNKDICFYILGSFSSLLYFLN